MRKYIRVRVDIKKTLKRFLRVKLGDPSSVVEMLFRYERLPKYCFGCGLVGHSVRECLSATYDLVKEGVNKALFGGWLRYSSPPKAEDGEGLGLTGINGSGGDVHGIVLHSAVHEVEFAPTGEVSPHLPSHSADNFNVMQKGDSFVDAIGFDGAHQGRVETGVTEFVCSSKRLHKVLGTGKLGSKVVEGLGSSPLR
ncbi:hypothetical protein ACOSP7_023283 [Xanthoceras sorbifolium]